jgi:hypothetical protein
MSATGGRSGREKQEKKTRMKPPREHVIAGIKSRGETIPDLKWEIKELVVAGNEVVVRGGSVGEAGRSAL